MRYFFCEVFLKRSRTHAHNSLQIWIWTFLHTFRASDTSSRRCFGFERNNAHLQCESRVFYTKHGSAARELRRNSPCRRTWKSHEGLLQPMRNPFQFICCFLTFCSGFRYSVEVSSHNTLLQAQSAAYLLFLGQGRMQARR